MNFGQQKLAANQPFTFGFWGGSQPNQPQPNPFGQTNQPNVFGQPNQPNAFGQPNQPNAFGQAQQQPNTNFGFGFNQQPNTFNQGFGVKPIANAQPAFQQQPTISFAQNDLNTLLDPQTVVGTPASPPFGVPAGLNLHPLSRILISNSWIFTITFSNLEAVIMPIRGTNNSNCKAAYLETMKFIVNEIEKNSTYVDLNSFNKKVIITIYSPFIISNKTYDIKNLGLVSSGNDAIDQPLSTFASNVTVTDSFSKRKGCYAFQLALSFDPTTKKCTNWTIDVDGIMPFVCEGYSNLYM